MKLHHLTLSLLLLGIFSHETGLSADSGGIAATTADTAAGQPVDNPFPESIAKGKVRLRLQAVTSGLVAPNWGTALANDPDHLYVGDQNGALWRIDLVTGEKEVFLDLPHRRGQPPSGAHDGLRCALSPGDDQREGRRVVRHRDDPRVGGSV